MPASGNTSMSCWPGITLLADLRGARSARSMATGGGPACLRLRVVLTAEEYQAVNPHVLDERYAVCHTSMTGWIATIAIVSPRPILADPQLLREGRDALDRLTQILQLGSV